jgi:hypothetical protein
MAVVVAVAWSIMVGPWEMGAQGEVVRVAKGQQTQSQELLTPVGAEVVQVVFKMDLLVPDQVAPAVLA